MNNRNANRRNRKPVSQPTRDQTPPTLATRSEGTSGTTGRTGDQSKPQTERPSGPSRRKSTRSKRGSPTTGLFGKKFRKRKKSTSGPPRQPSKRTKSKAAEPRSKQRKVSQMDENAEEPTRSRSSSTVSSPAVPGKTEKKKKSSAILVPVTIYVPEKVREEYESNFPDFNFHWRPGRPHLHTRLYLDRLVAITSLAQRLPRCSVILDVGSALGTARYLRARMRSRPHIHGCESGKDGYTVMKFIGMKAQAKNVGFYTLCDCAAQDCDHYPSKPQFAVEIHSSYYNKYIDQYDIACNTQRREIYSIQHRFLGPSGKLGEAKWHRVNDKIVMRCPGETHYYVHDDNDWMFTSNSRLIHDNPGGAPTYLVWSTEQVPKTTLWITKFRVVEEFIVPVEVPQIQDKAAYAFELVAKTLWSRETKIEVSEDTLTAIVGSESYSVPRRILEKGLRAMVGKPITPDTADMLFRRLRMLALKSDDCDPVGVMLSLPIVHGAILYMTAKYGVHTTSTTMSLSRRVMYELYNEQLVGRSSWASLLNYFFYGPCEPKKTVVVPEHTIWKNEVEQNQIAHHLLTSVPEGFNLMEMDSDYPLDGIKIRDFGQDLNRVTGSSLRERAGVTLVGIGESSCAPIIYGKSKNNTVVMLKTRILLDTEVDIKQGIWLAAGRVTAQHVRPKVLIDQQQWLNDTHPDEEEEVENADELQGVIGDFDDDYNFEQWVSRYPPRRQALYRKLRSGPLPTEKELAFGLFTKREKMVQIRESGYEPSRPRPIWNPPKKLLVFCGPAIWQLRNIYAKHWNFRYWLFYAGKATPGDLCEWFEYQINRLTHPPANCIWPQDYVAMAANGDDCFMIVLVEGKLYFYCTDFSKYDLTQQSGHKEWMDKRYEEDGLYRSKIVKRCLKKVLWSDVFHEGVKMRNVDMTSSGNPDTSGGNSQTTFTAMAFALIAYVQRPPEHPDEVSAGIARGCRDLGLKVKLNSSSNFSELEFLSGRFYPNGDNFVFFGKPGRFVSKAFWMVDQSHDYWVMQGYMLGTIKSYQVKDGGCPFSRVLLQEMEKWLSPIVKKVRYDRDAKFRLEKHCVEHIELQDNFWEAFHSVYGLSKTDEQAYHDNLIHFLANNPPPCLFTHWMTRRLIRIDYDEGL